MKKINTITGLREYLHPSRLADQQIGLVPTMGAIHEGHRSLMRAARAECDVVVVSIFVNPTQFGPGEDFDQYPRPLEDDLAACESEGADVVFCPEVAEMYPTDAVTTVSVAELTERLCGAHRPGHFDGVTTVVAKLFHIVQPDRAYFGQKDAQQAVVIQRMVRDLNFPLEIRVCPVVRETDGVALSSRNSYLSPQEREQARSLSQALFRAMEQIQSGVRDVDSLREDMRGMIEAAGPCEIDYIEIMDADNLQPKQTVEGRCLLAVAVKIGPSRLIDNIVVDAGQAAG